MWYRVFGSSDAIVQPADLLEYLHASGFEATGHFRGDKEGWFSAELRVPGVDEPLELQRYLASEPGIRDELNTWAAWLETQDHPERVELMRQVIQSRQVFTVPGLPELHEDGTVRELRRLVCFFLANQTGGICQFDGEGFFASDGMLLLSESARRQ